jgi:hypothetical protein
MARLEYIKYQPHRATIEAGEVLWVADTCHRFIEQLPQLFWADGTPWAEANHWALEKALNPGLKILTAQSLMGHLRAYANWLELADVDWRHFPMRKQDRVLVRYRGALITDRDEGRIGASTATARMNAVIQFYRHCGVYGFVSRQTPMWQDKQVVVRYYDSVGFERSMLRLSADIAIPNRARQGTILEDGLLPLTAEHQRGLLQYAAEHTSPELYLMLMTGFFVGARLGSITTLRIITAVRLNRE